jgi:hypothetical protein
LGRKAEEGNMSQIQLPECAVCGRPVERLERFERPDTGEIIFDAHCHGQVERVVVPVEWLQQVPAGQLRVCPAFQSEARMRMLTADCGRLLNDDGSER